MHLLIYNLSKHAELGINVPTAFVANSLEDGSPNYAESRVYINTATSYDIALEGVTLSLFELITSVQDEVLLEKFSPKGKKAKTFKKLIEVPKVKDEITAYIERQTDHFLRLLREHNLPIAIDLARRAFVPECLLTFAPSPEPFLNFKKTPEGVIYQLQFVSNGQRWRIDSRQVNVICNTPAWVQFDRDLVSIPDINGNMVKPFIKNESVSVANRFVRDYFQKFILRVAAKADIEADGFVIETRDKLEFAELNLIEFGDLFGLKLTFDYGGETFDWQSKTQQRTRLAFDGDEVALKQFRRQASQEAKYVEKLHSMLSLSQDNLLRPDGFSSPIAFAEWMTQEKTRFEEAGFKLAVFFYPNVN